MTVLNYADRRRVEIARAMTLRPDLLLLDEPAAGMNPAEVEQISRQIKELRDSGYTIILVEHQMPVVMGVSDRIMVVNKGQVLAQGTPREMQAHPEVIAAYLGEQEECDVTPKPSLVTGEPLLSLKGVEASYGPIKVLKGLDIDVYPGEIVCLLGANAAGKSTTIKTILGNVRASAGTIEFDGHRIEEWPTGRIVVERRSAGARRPAHIPSADRARQPQDGGLHGSRRGRHRARHRTGLRAVPHSLRAPRPEGRDRSPAASSRCWLSPGRS